ncbi:hypothetical protein DDT56_02095 [Brenneria corticis]|uniref:DUF2569 domain-containing protein n=1 Tax=Brenneria corticis TaxID=2173106 RepID=A0A2U1UAQ9_9GAMM|nr:hypothetical protein DDT56_02095 [Brenneria sp. CFCC 11842]
MEQDIIFKSVSIWPAVFYYIISTVVFLVLYYIKLIVDRKMKRPIFILYTLFVPIICALQFCIFGHGTSFVKYFLHIDVDVDAYDSIIYGALFFTILYVFAMPRNKYVKFV